MNLNLKVLTSEDVKQEYVDWFKDYDVIKYSDNQYKEFTLEGQKRYVQDCNFSNDIALFGIFDSEKHIGNISLTGLLSIHSCASVSYVIGNKKYWGKGVASFAISEVIEKCRNTFKINKLIAGVASENIGSTKVLEKNGFKLEGIKKNHLLYDGKYYDQIDYGILI